MHIQKNPPPGASDSTATPPPAKRAKFAAPAVTDALLVNIGMGKVLVKRGPKADLNSLKVPRVSFLTLNIKPRNRETTSSAFSTFGFSTSGRPAGRSGRMEWWDWCRYKGDGLNDFRCLRVLAFLHFQLRRMSRSDAPVPAFRCYRPSDFQFLVAVVQVPSVAAWQKLANALGHNDQVGVHFHQLATTVDWKDPGGHKGTLMNWSAKPTNRSKYVANTGVYKVDPEHHWKTPRKLPEHPRNKPGTPPEQTQIVIWAIINGYDKILDVPPVSFKTVSDLHQLQETKLLRKQKCETSTGSFSFRCIENSFGLPGHTL